MPSEKRECWSIKSSQPREMRKRLAYALHPEQFVVVARTRLRNDPAYSFRCDEQEDRHAAVRSL